MTAIKRILVPVDFSGSSRAALAHALELRAAFSSRVSVLHVYEPSGFLGVESLVLPPVDRPSQRWEQVRADLLRELERFLGLDRPSVDEVRVETGVPTDVIPEVARSGEFDLVLMGTRGQGPISHVAVGNVAEGVLRKAHCRVMTLRQPGRIIRDAVCM